MHRSRFSTCILCCISQQPSTTRFFLATSIANDVARLHTAHPDGLSHGSGTAQQAQGRFFGWRCWAANKRCFSLDGGHMHQSIGIPCGGIDSTLPVCRTSVRLLMKENRQKEDSENQKQKQQNCWNTKARTVKLLEHEAKSKSKHYDSRKPM